MKPSKFAAVLQRTEPNPLTQLLLELHNAVVQMSEVLEDVVRRLEAQEENSERGRELLNQQLFPGTVYQTPPDTTPPIWAKPDEALSQTTHNIIDQANEVLAGLEPDAPLTATEATHVAEPTPDEQVTAVPGEPYVVTQLRRQLQTERIKNRQLEDENQALLKEVTGHGKG